MRRVVFVDLDNTLFQTRKKNKAATQLAAVDSKGNPLSFQSKKQVSFHQWLSNGDVLLVPVTGRNVDALRRVRIPFSGLAVCSFGGVILDQDGSVNRVWDQHISDQVNLITPVLKSLCKTIQILSQKIHADVSCSVIDEAGKSLYLSVKPNNTEICGVSRISNHIRPMMPDRWTLHINGSNMALLPEYLSKEQAVSYLIETVFCDKDFMLIGVGDSLTDCGFMALCDFIITPGHSQIMDILRLCHKETTYPSGQMGALHGLF